MAECTVKTCAALLGTMALAVAVPATAAELRIQITLPDHQVASYYRPYLAAWIEEPETREAQGTAAVWYDTRLRDNLGVGFLRDLRKWWRVAGESMSFPADGISGPTRGPGTHEIIIAGDSDLLAGLAPGDYVLAVEATRENGERELLRAGFSWGDGENHAEITGTKELSVVKVAVAD